MSNTLFEGARGAGHGAGRALLTAPAGTPPLTTVPFSGPLKRVGSLESMHETLASDGRPELIRRLSSAGIERLPDRQMIANAVSKFARQQPPPTVYPGDEQGHFFTTPWNWAPRTASPSPRRPRVRKGRVAWRRSRRRRRDRHRQLRVAQAAFMTVRFTLDGMGEAFFWWACRLATTSRVSAYPSTAPWCRAEPLDRAAHLTIGVQNSRQSIDLMWGDESEGRLANWLLANKMIRLPAGSIPSRPILQPRRLLVYGDSIVEGVGADYRKGSSGDLQANVGLDVGVVPCDNLKCELSSVGYGRLGWSIQGNGNVPPFLVVGQSLCGRAAIVWERRLVEAAGYYHDKPRHERWTYYRGRFVRGAYQPCAGVAHKSSAPPSARRRTLSYACRSAALALIVPP